MQSFAGALFASGLTYIGLDIANLKPIWQIGAIMVILSIVIGVWGEHRATERERRAWERKVRNEGYAREFDQPWNQ